MKIATWNINSIRTRWERALALLERHELDILALQEIKCKPEQFPLAAFEDAGYHVAAHGLNQWNGVALISRLPLDDVRTSFPGQPGFTKGEVAGTERENVGYLDGPLEARAIGAHINGVDVWSVYIPNGRAIHDPHYRYKLDFLSALKDTARSWLEDNADAQFTIVGDWNVIPTDADVWDPAAMDDGLYLTSAEREAFFAFEQVGLTEMSRGFATNYTYWDYQRLRFPKNEGMRIDFLYGSPALAARAIAGEIDRDERKGKGASDHVPVIVEFE
ncbi:exodeoxyribonuclease III [Arcanobacterium canis]